MATISGAIDFDKAAKYPIVLSDALSGKGTKELFTGIRYNHKPTQPSGTSLSSHKLQPSSSEDPTNFDLSFKDGAEHYEYQGARNASDGQYALIFDPAKKHFVLHQVDSSFDMNLTSTPWDQDLDSLRSSYPQLQPPAVEPAPAALPPPPARPRRKSSMIQKSQPKGLAASNSIPNDTKRRKSEKPKKAKPKPREPTPDAEDEDSDGDLLIEYPDGPPPRPFQPYTTANVPPPPRREVFSEESEESDVDAEFEEDGEGENNQDVELLQLGSPARQVNTAPAANTVAVPPGSTVEDDEMDFDLDLEEALEQALATEAGEESSESEEE